MKRMEINFPNFLVLFLCINFSSASSCITCLMKIIQIIITMRKTITSQQWFCRLYMWVFMMWTQFIPTWRHILFILSHPVDSMTARVHFPPVALVSSCWPLYQTRSKSKSGSLYIRTRMSRFVSDSILMPNIFLLQ